MFIPHPNTWYVSLTALSVAVMACFAPSQTLAAQSDDLPKAAIVRGGTAATAPPTRGHGITALSQTDLCPSGDVCYDLHLRYITGAIRNPSFAETDPRGFDYLKLRGYVGNVEDESGNPTEQLEFVAPQVELAPGDTFRLTLHNDLAKAEDMALPWADCAASAPTHNDPHCANFNLTNMHTHGLWISPSGNSDNVLVSINPTVAFTYEYNIPEDHPAGTFWYHPHRHGSTSTQVASGVSGTLIIRGERMPTLGAARFDGSRDWQTAGDIDVILPRPGFSSPRRRAPQFPERVMLFQQIAYACRWTDEDIQNLVNDGDPLGQFAQKDRLYPGKIKTLWITDADGQISEGEWFCDPADVAEHLDQAQTDKLGNTHVGRIGTVEPGPETDTSDAFDLLTPIAWRQSGRHTAINGTVNKRFGSATTGRVERWRLIHAGVRETIKLQIRKAANDEAAGALLGAAFPNRHARDLNQVCSGEPLQVMGLATDGLTRSALDPRSETWLQPGYREDILLSFPEPGTYCILDTEVTPADNINAQESETALLGLIDVTGFPVQEHDAFKRIRNQLIQSAQARLSDSEVRAKVINDLENGGKLSAFVWHKPIHNDEITDRQTLAFQLGLPDDPSDPFRFEIGTLRADPANDALNAKHLPPITTPPEPVGTDQYDPVKIDRTLPLGKAGDWLMTSFGPVGHPFHIHVNPFEIVSVWQYEGDGINPSDPETWVDLSKPDNDSQYAGLKGTWKDTIFVQPGHLVYVRSRYQRYIGNFVLHCHILDHEDQGMMQNVRVALPDGRGGLETSGHGAGGMNGH